MLPPEPPTHLYAGTLEQFREVDQGLHLKSPLSSARHPTYTAQVLVSLELPLHHNLPYCQLLPQVQTLLRGSELVFIEMNSTQG